MTARRDEVQIAFDSGLRRMDITEIVRAIDDPKFAVSGCEIENLLIIRQDDERGEAQLGVNRNDIFSAVLHDTCAVA